MGSGSKSRANSAHAPRPANQAVDAALALALLLPVALLLWPDSLRDVPTTQSLAAGAGLLALLPAGLLLVARGLPRLAWPALLLLAVVLFAQLRGRAASDPFEARRALLVLISSFTCLLGGLRLGSTGRVWLQVGLAGACLVACAQSAWLSEPGGVLGNSGDLSEVALPGALLGIAWFAEQRVRASALGLAAALAFALHAALVPAWTGAAAFGAATLLALVLSIRQPALGRYGRIGAITTLMLALVALLAPSPQGPEEQSAPAPTSVSGLEVRRLLWGTVPAILEEHALLGFGPGQFPAAYPPFRDPAEIELSSHDRREPTPIDAEHLHSDWLQGPVDFGLGAGTLWILFLLTMGGRAVAALLRPGLERRGAALATCGVLVGAAGNSPLLDPVASHLAIFPLLGILLADDVPAPRRGALRARLLPALWLAVLALVAVPAARMVEHGKALTGLIAAPNPAQLEESSVLAATGAALRAAPDSSVALERRAKAPSRRSSERMRDLSTLLDKRPHHRAALTNRGIQHARGGGYTAALEDFRAALELDARMPAALSGAVRTSARGGLLHDLEFALAQTQQAALPKDLAEGLGLDSSGLRTLGLEVLRRGQPACAEALLLPGDARLSVTDPNVCWNLGQEARAAGDRALEDALLTAFHLDSARSHVAAADYGSAIRSYRQAQRFAGGAPEVTLELAAAQAAYGHLTEAQGTLEALGAELRAAARPQRWATETLRKEGLGPARQE